MRLLTPGAILVIGTAALAASGCKDRDPPAPLPFQIFIRVESEPGQKVTGASVSRNDKVLGTTGPDGRAMLAVHGVEGKVTEVSVKCPEAFTSPPKPTSIRLKRFADKTKIPEFSVTCPPALRHVVIAVRADNGPNLPVVYGNKVITRTDLSGAAHFALEIAPGALFQVTLDTTENARLKPPSPSRPFTAPAHDDILVFDQRFEVNRPRPGAPRPPLPRQIN